MEPIQLQLPEGWERTPSVIFNEEIAQQFIDKCQERGIPIVSVQHMPEGENTGRLQLFTNDQVCVLSYQQDTICLETFSLQRHNEPSFSFSFE